jgi:hypothetical protein
MAETPQTCPTCSTPVPDGAVRCPGCGRVFGEANRCPHCNAVAAVIRRGTTTVCAACGKPRAGTVVLGEGEMSHGTRAMLSRARGTGFRGFGVLAIASGILGAALAAIAVSGVAGIAAAAVVGAIGVTVGALSLRAGARASRAARDERQKQLERELLVFAKKSRGRVIAAEAGKALGISEDEADAALTAMVGDGSKVDVDVDGEGVVAYVFRDIGSHPKVRVEENVEEELESSSKSAEQQKRTP